MGSKLPLPRGLDADDLDMLRVIRDTQPCRPLEVLADFAKYVKAGLVVNVEGGLGLSEEAEALLSSAGGEA